MSIQSRLKKVSKKVWITLGVIVVLLVGLRIALPHVLLNYLNKTLADIGKYTGHVQDVDLNLIKGSYTLDSLVIEKKDGPTELPFIVAPELVFSLHWKAFWKGNVVMNVNAKEPVFNFISAKSEAATQDGQGGKWRFAVDDIVPFEVDKLIVENATIHHRDFSREPNVHLRADSVHFEALNLTNAQEEEDSMPTDIKLKGMVMHHAPITVEGSLNPFDSLGTFHFKLNMDGLQLPEINSFLEGFAALDAEKGTFNLEVELTSTSGKMEGYILPVAENTVIFDIGSEEGDIIPVVLWEGFAQLFTLVLENPETGEIKAKIPLNGDYKQLNKKMLPAIGYMFKNSVIHALIPNIAKKDKKKSDEG